MGIYIVVINGEVATVADLDAADAEALGKFVDEQVRFERVRVIEVEHVETSLFGATAEVEQALDSWRQ